MRRLLEHRGDAFAIAFLAARGQRARVLEQHAGADRARAEQLAAGESGREVPIGVRPALEQGRELAEAEGDRSERLLGVGDGVVASVREQELVQLRAAPLVADEDARVGERAQVEDPETVARELGEAPYGVALELAPRHLLVAELGGGERVPPPRDPREALAVVLISGQNSGRRPCAHRIASICA